MAAPKDSSVQPPDFETICAQSASTTGTNFNTDKVNKIHSSITRSTHAHGIHSPQHGHLAHHTTPQTTTHHHHPLTTSSSSSLTHPPYHDPLHPHPHPGVCPGSGHSRAFWRGGVAAVGVAWGHPISAGVLVGHFEGQGGRHRREEVVVIMVRVMIVIIFY